MISIIVAIIVFSIIVLVHEFGHFIVARMNGVFVEEFAIGMGPKLISKKIGETVYSIRILPLGGFCKMTGEEENSDDARAFCNKSVWQRMAIVVAGALMNFIYALIAIIIAVSLMNRVSLPIIDIISPNSPAEKAGLMKGDKVLYINDTKVGIMEDILFETALLNTPEKKVNLVIERNGERKNITSSLNAGIVISSIPQELEGKTNLKLGDFVVNINGKDVYNIKDIGNELENKSKTNVQVLRNNKIETLIDENTKILIVNQARIQRQIGFLPIQRKLNFIESLDYSEKKFEYFIRTTWVSLGKLVTGQVSFKLVSGPIGIVKYLGDTYEKSVNASSVFMDQVINVSINLLMFSALLSANLGVINLMPVPALDGGRLVFMFVELIRGKPVDVEKENWVHVLGFGLLMILMVFVFYNDIMKLVNGIV
ncbi:MAG TPA: RIP metalloprotease RseP [Clostridiales bacterium]|nr:MAG: RIP metalloprotease RseP [Clostridiales bacterium GWD2_32_59]HAN10576.1 RIP metalloprotease RseP [Clostridiales bacterium]